MEPNIMVRTATKEDIPAFHDLWKICFGDSDVFCQWLFSERFYPEYSVVLEKDGQIVSCMQAVPYEVMVRGQAVSGAMLCGVSTHPAHRGKGYMGKIFAFSMNLLRQKGLLLAVHTPAVLPSYFSYGHFPVADATYFSCEKVPSDGALSDTIHYFDGEYEALYSLYQEYMALRFSGILQRTKEEFLRKCNEYTIDGKKCIIYKDSEIRGYAFVYETSDSVIGAEVVAADGYYHKLLPLVAEAAVGKQLSVKLPPNLFVNMPFGTMGRVQKGVAGVANLQGLLEALAIPCEYTVQVTDHIVEENQGVFSFEGKISKKLPTLKIDAGHFLEVLLGYVTLDEIRDFVTIYDQEGFIILNELLEKQNCYIIDEY